MPPKIIRSNSHHSIASGLSAPAPPGADGGSRELDRGECQTEDDDGQERVRRHGVNTDCHRVPNILIPSGERRPITSGGTGHGGDGRRDDVKHGPVAQRQSVMQKVVRKLKTPPS